jgi:hypothetical protein
MYVARLKKFHFKKKKKQLTWRWKIYQACLPNHNHTNTRMRGNVAGASSQTHKMTSDICLRGLFKKFHALPVAPTLLRCFFAYPTFTPLIVECASSFYQPYSIKPQIVPFPSCLDLRSRASSFLSSFLFVVFGGGNLNSKRDITIHIQFLVSCFRE